MIGCLWKEEMQLRFQSPNRAHVVSRPLECLASSPVVLKGQASMVTRSQEIYAYERCAMRDAIVRNQLDDSWSPWYRADRTWKFNVWANIHSAWTKFYTRCNQTSSKLGSALVLNITGACWPLQVKKWNFMRKRFNLPNRPALPKPLSLRKRWFVTGNNFMSHRK